MAPKGGKHPPKQTATAATAASAVAVPPAKDENRTLASKEQTLFKQVLQQYETKQWRKGLKTAEQILKVKPEHGETLAMKGLFLSSLDRKEEGYEHVKRGVRNDMGSHIVWHVYGLMHRADKNWEEALKCYSQANKIERDSLNILGDLAILSIHLRNYPLYVDSRLSILRVAPRLRRNWLGLAIAQHLNGQFAEADRTLRNYEEMLRDVPEGEYDLSEVLLYHATVLDEAGEWERSIEFLQENTGKIVDRQSYSVLRAHLLLKLGRKEPAEWAWELLLEENPDNYEYIKAYVKARGADVDSKDIEQTEAAVKVLDALAEKFPRSLAVRRIALDIVSGQGFETRASSYLTNALSKGVPSIFADVKALYSDREKRQTIGKLAEGYLKALEATETFGVPELAEDDTVESSAAYLWTLYFLAQHYSALSEHSKSLQLLDQAEQHTPSLPEISMLRARVLKRAGDVDGALEAMTAARELDGQDRFLNSKNAKYFLRADRVEEAEKCVGLFTKQDAPSPLQDLIDMQCFWFIEEEGLSYARQGKLALALKRYHQIYNIFNEVDEDQYDFHSYSIRKYTIRAYINLLRYNDQLRSHFRYRGAAKGAINIYLRMHDNPSSISPAPLTNGALEAVAQAEREKAAKKEDERRAKEEAEKEEAAKAASKKEKGKKVANKKPAEEEEPAPAPAVDIDPNGERLLATATPLEDALKFLRPLEKVAGAYVETWALSFEIAVRREKYLQALRALRNAHALDAKDPSLHPLIVRFKVLVSSLPADFNASLKKTLDDGLNGLMGNRSVEVFNAEALQIGGSKYTLASAKGTIAFRGDAGKSETEELLFQLLKDADATLDDTVEALVILRSLSSSRSDEFVKAATAKFPLARVFKTKEELAALKAKREGGAIGDEGKEVVEE
ncbi:N-terminal acetyltransferase A, auxiliary subunit [Meredithblackwellia eburnea MCA 4105]